MRGDRGHVVGREARDERRADGTGKRAHRQLDVIDDVGDEVHLHGFRRTDHARHSVERAPHRRVVSGVGQVRRKHTGPRGKLPKTDAAIH